MTPPRFAIWAFATGRRCLGVNFRRMPDANGRPYLVMVAWYPTRLNLSRLGYLYASLPIGIRRPA